MRLTDADAFKAELRQIDCVDKFGWVLIPITKLNIMLEKCTVDAEPVVRCKDCRFYRFYDGVFGKGWMCFENNTVRHGDDYCSRGERKDDA